MDWTCHDPFIVVMLDSQELLHVHVCSPTLPQDSDFLPGRALRNDSVTDQAHSTGKHRAAKHLHGCRDSILSSPTVCLTNSATAGCLQEHLELEEGEAVKAVLTVPSSFSHFQRKAVSDAAAIAGLDVLQLVNETTAAAIQFAMDSFDASGQVLANAALL